MRYVILVAALLIPFSALADEDVGYMQSTSAATEEANWSAFLAANPRHYNAAPVILPLTDDLKALTKRINVEVNRFPYEPDGTGDADHWKLLTEGAGGDCEDYVLTKRDRLIKAGLPAGALLPAIIELDGDPDAHMVLVLLTDKGDFIMDNVTDWITPWNEARWPDNGKDYHFTYRLYGGTTWQMIAD